MSISKSLEDRLDREFAAAWKPSAGNVLVGEVVDISERQNEFGTYPIVTLLADDGDEYAVHAFHKVLRRQLGEQRPRLGERIGLKYKGVAPAGYHDYALVVDRDEPAGVDLSKYAEAEADERAAPQTDVPSDLEAPAAGPDDEDIPF